VRGARLTRFLRLPPHTYNTSRALNHHQHYDHSGRAANSVQARAVATDVLCDAPDVLDRAHALMVPGVRGLAEQLLAAGFAAPPKEWWDPPRCAAPSSEPPARGPQAAQSSRPAAGARQAPPAADNTPRHATADAPQDTPQHKITLAATITGLVRTFVVPSVWRSIGRGLSSLLGGGGSHGTTQLFLCPSDEPSAAGPSGTTP